MRTLIAGCGYVGSALGERLAADGHAVWGLRPRFAPVPGGLRPAPPLGEHNDYIYGEILGMSGAEVATLRDRAII